MNSSNFGEDSNNEGDEQNEKRRDQYTDANDDSQLSSFSQTADRDVIFESPVVYGAITKICLIAGLAAPSICLLGAELDARLNDRAAAAFYVDERNELARVLIGITMALIFMYAIILPRKIQLRSNATVVVRTILPPLSFSFGRVVAAYEMCSSSSAEMFQCWPPRINFFTDFQHCVLVRRKDGWDVMVSPEDYNGFIAAVWKMSGRQHHADHVNDGYVFV